MQLHRARSLLVGVAALSAAMMAPTEVPAQAAARTPVTTHITVAAAPTVAVVGSIVTVSGSVTPPATSLTLRLQVAHKGVWTTLSTTRALKSGVFTLHLLGPRVAQTLPVRVIRLGTAAVKPVTSRTLHLRFVSHKFLVTAATQSRSLPAGGALTVSGAVRPTGTGAVYLQRLTPPATWVTVAKAALTKTGAYVAHTTVAEGANTYRVLRPSSAVVAAGLSATLHVVGNSPVVATTTLPAAVDGQPYQTSLTATLGTPPYQWSVNTLPAGLRLSPTGTISGRPLAVGSTSAIVTVTDANGWTGSATLPLVVSPVSVKAWGDNVYGQLGNGTTTASAAPVTTLLPGTVQAVSGYDFTLAVTTGGTVYAWGHNDHGQLGNGTTVNQATPTLVPGLTNVVAVSGGGETSYAVKADGTLWSWGGNTSGQLGNGTTADTLAPAQVPGLTGVVAVSAGGQFVLALRSDGSVYAWGDNSDFQLGHYLPTATMATTPVTVEAFGIGGERAVAISAGLASGYALIGDGTVFSWGSQAQGALGNGVTSLNGNTTATAIAGLAGVSALSCPSAGVGCHALLSDGTVDAWGANREGQLGNNTTADSAVPIVVPGLAGITQLASAAATGYALTSTGAVESWGSNVNGALGNGSAVADQLTAAPIPGLASVDALFATAHSAYTIQAG